MSARDSKRQSLAGLTLDDVLAKQKKFHATQQAQALAQAQGQAQPQPKVTHTRTLIDIIKEDETNKKDRRSWKAFKDKILLKRAGTAWISTIGVPTSDIPIRNPNSRIFTQLGRRNSVRHLEHNSDSSTHYMAHQPNDLDPTSDFNPSPTPSLAARPQFSRRSSTRYGLASEAPFTAGDPTEPAPGGSVLRPSLSRRNSTSLHSAASEPYRRGRVVTFRDSFEDEDEDEDGIRPGRALSAREAVAAQEAAEAAAAAERDGEDEGRPMTMSLMDLLEETDREMGLEGSRYILSDEDDEFDDDEEEDEEGVEGAVGEGDMEYTCSVCMVRHKANAISLCGHSYCRMCSRELSVNKGNCPLCNNFIAEILEIF